MASKVEFVKSASGPEQAPPEPLPEVAFLGPSNVGKSSLINALLGRKGLARVSKTPGRTQLLNFFRVDGRLHVVDLPGYGFAKVPKKVQEGLLRMVERYLAGSQRLALLVLLLDCRRDPSPRDRELQTWLVDNDVPHAVVLTKTDKISRQKVQRRAREVERILGLDRLEAQVLPFSAHTGVGRAELWRVIEAALREFAG